MCGNTTSLIGAVRRGSRSVSKEAAVGAERAATAVAASAESSWLPPVSVCAISLARICWLVALDVGLVLDDCSLAADAASERESSESSDESESSVCAGVLS